MLLRVLCLFSILSVLLIRPSLTIEVTPNSHCASLCMDKATNNPANDQSSLTVASDVVCSDAEYVGSEATLKGRKLNDCLSCEQKSNATDAKTGQNDQYWLLCTFCALRILTAFFIRVLRSIADDVMELISQYEIHYQLVCFCIPQQPGSSTGAAHMLRCVRRP